MFLPYLTEPLNVLHFQDSCGSGRTCRIMLDALEAEQDTILPFASLHIVHPDDAFDRANSPESTVKRIEVPKDILKELELLDEEDYVRRCSVIMDESGEVLAILPVANEAELSTHVRDQLIPALQRLSEVRSTSI